MDSETGKAISYFERKCCFEGTFFCPTVINTEAILQTNVTCCL